MIKIIKNIIPLALLTTAIIQWYGIGERTYHAWWMWYKFKDYGGGGYTTISIDVIVATYALSIFLIVCGVLTRSYWQLSLTSRYVNTIAVGMLSIGVVCLSLLLASPFAVIVNR